MSIVIRFEGMANGSPSPYDGQYLVEYDPERDGESPEGRTMIAHITASAELAEARRFADTIEATECWRRVCEREPTRPDGQPNRPLTAFNVAILPEDQAAAS